MKFKVCPECYINTPIDAFRKDGKRCVWCLFKSMEKRAKSRFSDKIKSTKDRLQIDKDQFVAWYISQHDRCFYCGLTFEEVKKLKLRKGRGYFVSWEIDRLNPLRDYEPGNLALSCFVCNMAKGNSLTPEETKKVGTAIRGVWKKRLSPI